METEASLMPKSEQRTTFRQFQTLFDHGTFAGLSDRQLLELFRERAGARSETAFAALMERHGPMVLRTCRAVLRDEHAAEDSFQATFLFLTRRASLLWVRESLGPWLYQVAYRVALAARSAEGRRRRHEQTKATLIDSSLNTREWDDLGYAIHEELARLPMPYRAPIVLCCMEGQTQAQAAKHLGLALGTLQSRLARGRRRLQNLLIRRGLAPSVGALTSLPHAGSSRTLVPEAIRHWTLQAAMSCASGRSAPYGGGSAAAATLIIGMTKTMFVYRIKFVLGAIVVAAVTAAGVAVWARQTLQIEPAGVVAVETAAPSTALHSAPLATEDTPPIERTTEAGESRNPQEPPREQRTAVVKYSDGQADGKKSLGGSGEMIEFSMPAGYSKVVGIRIHGSRYGHPQPPEESFLIYFLNHDRTRVLHTQMAPYSLFERGHEQWVDVAFERLLIGLDNSRTFWVALDFRAAATKGVYVSFDTSTGGKHSRVGLPGMPSSPLKFVIQAEPQLGGARHSTEPVNFGADWMIEAKLAP
jgi:RNA polymerase sigma factor (sigma-70 family)